MRRTAMERFLQKVKPADDGTDCILWTACKQRTGYGKFGVNYRTVVAHRWIFEQTYGLSLKREEQVLHSCDRRSCVNVDHLRVGTAKENMQDMDARGRRVRGNVSGIANGNARLTEAIVRACRERHAAGSSYSSLARQYGVSVQAVRMAVIGETWRHVQDAA